MFVKGSFEGNEFDNTAEVEVSAWINVLRELNPLQVMIYSIARETPLQTIQKISVAKLKEIASLVEKNGISTSISG
jgi:hypothetical protein